MRYVVDPRALTGVFVLPTAVADRWLKLASGDFIKVLLALCRRLDAPQSQEDLSAVTGLAPATVLEALSFWEDKGLLTAEENLPAPAVPPAADAPAAAPEPEKPARVAVMEKPNLPSYDMICKRTAESETVRVLFSEAQGKLGRTIGPADQSRLLLLLDYYGLPVEVILTICEYAHSHGKTISQIYSMGIDWAKREIDTIEAADEECKRLESVGTMWFAFAEKTGIRLPKLSSSQQKYFETWKTEWRFSDEMIRLAFDEMRANTDSVSFPYMNKVLSNWKKDGLDTPEKVAAQEKERALEKERQAAEKKSPYREKKEPLSRPETSYDIEEAQRRMETTVPKLKKKEARK